MGKLGRIPPGIGPKHSQVIVLVGATGDLSRRKLLPGLFHLSSAGFIPGCRIIGVSLDNIDPHGFREVAREALNQFSSRKVKEADWATFAETLEYVPMASGAPASGGRKSRGEIRHRESSCELSKRAAQGRLVGSTLVGGSRSRRYPCSKHHRRFAFIPPARGGQSRSISWLPPMLGACPSSGHGATQTPKVAEREHGGDPSPCCCEPVLLKPTASSAIAARDP